MKMKKKKEEEDEEEEEKKTKLNTWFHSTATITIKTKTVIKNMPNYFVSILELYVGGSRAGLTISNYPPPSHTTTAASI